MKKIFVCFVLANFIFAAALVSVVAASVPGMPDQSDFVLAYEAPLECGYFKRYDSETEGVSWVKYFIHRYSKTGSTYIESPNPLAIMKFEKTSGLYEFWLDQNRDGFVEKYYLPNPMPGFYDDYPMPCDAVK